MTTIKSQIAEKFQVSVQDLVAVLFYSDRSYSTVTVFGTHLGKFKKYVEGLVGQKKNFTSFGWDALKAVPPKGYIVDATVFGLEEGKVLLVSGRAP